MSLRIIVRGGGDLASGVVLRMARAGWQVIVLELENPLAVRRCASFAQAVFEGQITVEGVRAQLAVSPDEADAFLSQGVVAVFVDPNMDALTEYAPDVIVDARMMKQEVRAMPKFIHLVIGLGPGFRVGLNCHAVIETKRGPNLGRVYWEGVAEMNTGVPDRVGDFQNERVLRSPSSGAIHSIARIGDKLSIGATIATVNGQVITAAFPGVLRGLVRDGLSVIEGMKIGDLDPRNDPELCFRVSDKALAVGGGVLEAILSSSELRRMMWS